MTLTLLLLTLEKSRTSTTKFFIYIFLGLGERERERDLPCPWNSKHNNRPKTKLQGPLPEKVPVSNYTPSFVYSVFIHTRFPPPTRSVTPSTLHIVPPIPSRSCRAEPCFPCTAGQCLQQAGHLREERDEREDLVGQCALVGAVAKKKATPQRILGFGSERSEEIERSTLAMERAGDQLSLRMSRQMPPWLLMLQW